MICLRYQLELGYKSVNVMDINLANYCLLRSFGEKGQHKRGNNAVVGLRENESNERDRKIDFCVVSKRGFRANEAFRAREAAT